jgi:CheY-like chemotaxis protein
MADNMETYLNLRQRKPTAEPGSPVKQSVCEMTMNQMEVQSVWKELQQSPAAKAANDIDVCLVEDDSSIISLVQVLLKPEGIDVLAVESCEAAIEALRHTRPRLLLVDLGMPDRSGLEVARMVRGWYDYPHMPIVALTGSAEKAGAAWRAGFSGFIPKPFVGKTFQIMVKSWISAMVH